MIHNHRNEDWKIPYLGVAYYPEAWDKNELDSDILKMGQFGIKVVRIGEFAWQRMEAKPGSFDFSFFKDVIKRLSDASIKVILGTPTATPPIWLTTLDPKMLMEQESGRRTQHGGRRHCCSNNPIYYAYSMRIVEQMAKEFSEETSIIGWQIDNETDCVRCNGLIRF